MQGPDHHKASTFVIQYEVITPCPTGMLEGRDVANTSFQRNGGLGRSTSQGSQLTFDSGHLLLGDLLLGCQRIHFCLGEVHETRLPRLLPRSKEGCLRATMSKERLG